MEWVKLDIWDKAQREAAQRRKSDWWDNLVGWNSAPGNVTRPELNRISLHIMRTGDLAWVEMRQLNFVVSGPKFTRLFSSNVGWIVVDNAVSRVYSRSKSEAVKIVQNFESFWPPFFFGGGSPKNFGT